MQNRVVNSFGGRTDEMLFVARIEIIEGGMKGGKKKEIEPVLMPPASKGVSHKRETAAIFKVQQS